MNTFLLIAPYALLLLSGVGFILTFIADHYRPENRMKVGLLLVLLACVSVATMR